MDAYIEARYQDELRHQHRRRLLFVLVIGLALSSLGASAFSLALFTDTATVSSNAFTSGSVDITAIPATAVIGYSDMMPADSVTGTLTVGNAGLGQLRYAMTSSSTNADGKSLLDAITLEIRTVGTSCAAFDGTLLYTGTLGAATFGNTTAGFQAGDRTLDAATSEVICVKAALPSGTADSYQAAATTTTFTFEAEQTANNP